MLKAFTIGLTAGAVALATVLGSTVALAVDEPENIIKYRQATMRAIGGHMGMLGAIAKNEVSFTDEAQGHAHAINELSQNLERLFPEGTGRGDTDVETRALPVIWEQMDEVREIIGTLQEESARLVEITEGDFERAAFAQQLGVMGQQGCGACHETFRAEAN